jgi:hypothetical protein
MIEYIDCETFDRCEYCNQGFEPHHTVYMGWSKCFCSRRCRDKYYKKLKQRIVIDNLQRDLYKKVNV